MTSSRRRIVGYLLVPLLAGTGCTSYRADPLDPVAELASFTQRDLTTARAAARTSAHPVANEATLDEQELVAIALRLNPTLAASRARLGLAEAALIEAGTWPNPELALAVRGGSPGLTADLDLLAVLLRPGERSARRAAAEAGQRETMGGIAAEEWQVVTAVRSARLDVLTALALQHVAQDTADLSRRAAQALERRRTLDDASELDVATARAEAGTAERELREATAAVAMRSRALNRLLGVPVDIVIPLTGAGTPMAMIDASSDVPADLPQAVLTGRWDLAVAKAVYERSDHELQLAISKQYPALRIGPSASRDSEGTTIGGALSLELPIFDRNQGGIRAAQAKRDEARALYQAALQQALGEAAEAVAAVRFASDEIAALDADLMPSAKRALDLADRAVQARDMELIDYLVVRRTWLSAQRARLDVVAAAHRALITLDAAIGRGPATLSRPDAPAATPRAQEAKP